MDNPTTPLGQWLTDLDTEVSTITPEHWQGLEPAALLALVEASARVAGRLAVLAQQIAGHAETTQAAATLTGVSLRTWLTEHLQMSPREAARHVIAGTHLASYPIIAHAATTGTITPHQAEVITRMLIDLPDDLGADTLVTAQETLIDHAQQFHPGELRRLSTHLLQVLAPDTAEAIEADRVEREHRQAMRNRHLNFTNDGHGQTHLAGSLPTIDAEHLRQLVDAYSPRHPHSLDRLDPQTDPRNRAMRRADGLIALVHHHTQEALAPSHGGDRPRLVVTIGYTDLEQRCINAHLTESGEQLPAQVLRRLACDADILPITLSGPSQVLDVGREHRLVTPPIRAALNERDQGCIFPGCDQPPRACEAHHLQPWWAGGITALSNLVLACPHHHGIIEPSRDPTEDPRDRWQVRLRDDGLPHTIPPRRVDPHQKPRLHARHTTPHPPKPDTPPPETPTPPPPQDNP